MPKSVKVKTSKAHRRKKHDVSPHKRKTSKAFRIKTHFRKSRRTDAQINAVKKRSKPKKKSAKKKKVKFAFPKKYYNKK